MTYTVIKKWLFCSALFSHHKQRTSPQSANPDPPLWSDVGLVVSYHFPITAFTPAYKRQTKWINAPEFVWTELNKFGVKAPKHWRIHKNVFGILFFFFSFFFYIHSFFPLYCARCLQMGSVWTVVRDYSMHVLMCRVANSEQMVERKTERKIKRDGG